MKIEKKIEVSLSLRDMSEIYSRNYKEGILKTLREIYTNRCFKSMLIQEVIQVDRISEYRCKSQVDDGSIEVDIVMLVSGLTFFTGEIIPDCELVSLSAPGSIYGKALGGSVSVSIKRNAVTPSFKDKDVVPIVALNVRYAPLLQEVTIRAEFLWPTTLALSKDTLLQVVEGSEPEKELFFSRCQKLIKEYENVIASLADKFKEQYAFFAKLLNTDTKPVKPSGFKTLALDNIKLAVGDVLLKPAWSLFDSTALVSQRAPTDAVPEKCTAQHAMLTLAEVHLQNLHNFRCLVEHFDNNDKIMKLADFWTRFKKAIKQ